jgi:diguanylate cyclase (GGDEF)-like protein
MSSAATTATPAAQREQPVNRPRRAKQPIARKAGLQLLAGLLLVAGIPVVATVHILNSNALRNERARADSALRAQLQGAVETVGRLGDDASNRAEDLSRSPALQRAFLTADVAALERLARQEPGMVFYLQKQRVAGSRPRFAIARSVSLTFNQRQVGIVLATVSLDNRLGARLLRAVPHAPGDRLYVVRQGVIAGTDERFLVEGQNVRLAKRAYRGSLSPVPNAGGVSLLALRPEKIIEASVRPYQQRVMYAAVGSFALLVLLALLFARPIMRTLGDFRRVASQAVTDALTGLANRRSFDEELALEWRRAERVGDPLALILADIDNFKQVNDRYGHQLGDEVLRKVGEVIGSTVRQVDFAARYGGEEFAVIVPETDLDGAVKLAERLRTDLMKAHVELTDGTQLQVTASFGVAVNGELNRAEELIAAADEALYEAKRAGKNRVAPEAFPAGESDASARPERRRRPAAAKTSAKQNPANAPAKKKPAKTPAMKRKAPSTRPVEGEI